MKANLKKIFVYLATNKKARAAEYTFLLAMFEAVRSSLGHP